MVVSNILYLYPYLGRWSNVTHIFQLGWFNHQLENTEAAGEDFMAQLGMALGGGLALGRNRQA